MWFSKHNDVGIHGELEDSSGSAIPADAVNGLDEIAKRQCLLFVIGIHAKTIYQEALGALWGVDPIGEFDETTCYRVAGRTVWLFNWEPERLVCSDLFGRRYPQLFV